jgi:hypothetical protein
MVAARRPMLTLDLRPNRDRRREPDVNHIAVLTRYNQSGSLRSNRDPAISKRPDCWTSSGPCRCGNTSQGLTLTLAETRNQADDDTTLSTPIRGSTLHRFRFRSDRTCGLRHGCSPTAPVASFDRPRLGARDPFDDRPGPSGIATTARTKRIGRRPGGGQSGATDCLVSG